MSEDRDAEKELFLKAAQVGDLPIITALFLRSSMLANALDAASGQTALHKAALYGHFEIVRFLLKRRSGLAGMQDVEGNTALHLAVVGRHARIVKLLLERAPELTSVRNNAGKTALDLALESTRIAAIIRKMGETDG